MDVEKNAVSEKRSWINKNVIIDFEIPESLKELVRMCEEADKEENWGYFEFMDALDIGCKELCAKGVISEKQWNKIMERYET